jgi:hypothetical protein
MKASEAIAGLFILLLSFAVLVPVYCYAQDEIMPVNPPQVQLKAVHILTANERSEILIKDIWKPTELFRVKIGTGAALGLQKKASDNKPAEPYGWQAYVAQDARSSWQGGYQAVAYGEM